jgi:ABC-2 type transport system permease protein
MRSLLLIFRREFAAYFATPLAAVFLAVFVAVSSGMTFFVSSFFERAQADLSTFFTWQPWLFLVLMPAVGMRLWAEERRLGTIELLMTLPVQPWKFVLGKWLAAFAFAGLALVFTMPLWITVNYLGSPDNGVILASYLGAWLMAGAFLAIASCVSALTNNQVLALFGAVIVGFLFVMAGFDLVLSAVRPWAPDAVTQAIASMSFIGHFQRITDGVFEASALVFFVSLIAFALWLNVQILDARKAA